MLIAENWGGNWTPRQRSLNVETGKDYAAVWVRRGTGASNVLGNPHGLSFLRMALDGSNNNPTFFSPGRSDQTAQRLIVAPYQRLPAVTAELTSFTSGLTAVFLAMRLSDIVSDLAAYDETRMSELISLAILYRNRIDEIYVAQEPLTFAENDPRRRTTGSASTSTDAVALNDRLLTAFPNFRINAVEYRRVLVGWRERLDELIRRFTRGLEGT